LKNYLEKHHFASHAAYQQYADDLLQHKINLMLGKEPEIQNERVNWQYDSLRTMPSEHVINESVDSVLHRDDLRQINNNNEQELLSGIHGEPVPCSDMVQPEQVDQIEHLNEMSGRKEVDSVRDLLNKQVYREARDVMVMPNAMTHTRNLYENKLILKMMEP